MKSLLKSFVYAFHGIISTIKTQRNFRIHIIAAIYVTAFSLFYDFSKMEYIVLVLIFALVISLELVNTALENTVDLYSSEYDKLAEKAKDCAAGAVLTAAIGAVIIGVFLFADINAFKRILRFYCDNNIAFAGLILSIVAAVLFVFYPSGKMKGKNNGYKN